MITRLSNSVAAALLAEVTLASDCRPPKVLTFLDVRQSGGHTHAVRSQEHLPFLFTCSADTLHSISACT